MANSNLAQAEPYLKQLERTLKEIGDLHKQIHDALSDTTIDIDTQGTISILNVSWSKVVNLFVVVDGLRQFWQEPKDV